MTARNNTLIYPDSRISDTSENVINYSEYLVSGNVAKCNESDVDFGAMVPDKHYSCKIIKRLSDDEDDCITHELYQMIVQYQLVHYCMYEIVGYFAYHIIDFMNYQNLPLVQETFSELEVNELEYALIYFPGCETFDYTIVYVNLCQVAYHKIGVRILPVIESFEYHANDILRSACNQIKEDELRQSFKRMIKLSKRRNR